MPKRPISYTSRDFESIKEDLVNYAKRYYPTSFKDFNEASFGALMMDLVAYVGDQLSFYTDYQANESFLESALEYKNIVRSAEQLGFKMPGAASATGICSFYVIVPASAVSGGPDSSYIPILKEGTIVSSGTAVFTLNEDVDFSDPSNEITVARVDDDTGVPTSFAIKAFGEVLSGQLTTTTIAIGEYQRFLTVEVDDENIVEMISVTDTQGNEYSEVEYLTQDIVLKQIKNYNSDKIAVPYVIKTEPVPRRFTTQFTDTGGCFLQFGFGSAANLTTDVIVDPADVLLDVTGRNYITDKTFDPSNLIETDKFGVVPTNTTLTVVYRKNNSLDINAPVNAVNEIVSPNFVFQNEALLVDADRVSVVQSIEVDNEQPILGDIEPLLEDEIRKRAYASFASQNRAVTREDYISVCYRMPSKFGKIKRANVEQDKDSFRRNLNVYILAEDTVGNLTQPNATLKENLKTWLLNYKMVNDTVDILDAKIINYGINFEIVPDLEVNRYELLDRCINVLVERLAVKNNIGQAIDIAEIYKILNDVPGVVDTSYVELVNKAGGIYSSLYYDINANLSDDGRFLLMPEDTVAEILVPASDITGVVR